MNKSTIIITLISFVFGFVVCRCDGRHSTEQAPLHDTIVTVKTDTVMHLRPEAHHRRIIRHDTLFISCTDTLRDTVQIPLALPIEQREYRDTDYQAWVSGWHPTLDSIHIYRHHIERSIIERKTNTSRWSVGISAGMGMTPHGAVPYIGIGLSYRIVDL